MLLVRVIPWLSSLYLNISRNGKKTRKKHGTITLLLNCSIVSVFRVDLPKNFSKIHFKRPKILYLFMQIFLPHFYLFSVWLSNPLKSNVYYGKLVTLCKAFNLNETVNDRLVNMIETGEFQLLMKLTIETE